jgi:hypothetical protein
MSLTVKELQDLSKNKAKLLKKFFEAEPPKEKGEDLVDLWAEIYDDAVRDTVIHTSSGPSDNDSNPVFPYEKLCAIVGDGGNWKWPRAWECMDQLQRRGPAYRQDDPINLGIPNPNPHIVAQHVLVVGGGPVGLRLAIELKLGGHYVTVFEKRREIRTQGDELEVLGFTNRINRPHVFNFLRNDLERLNGRNWMSSKMCYPIFTQGDTASIGIDELQMLLLKNALLLGVDFRLGVSFDDGEMLADPITQKPRWQVKCTYDAQAAATKQISPGLHTEVFDVLMGCDGARSRVRESQPEIFGEVDKRNFKKMIGIVGNIQKVSRQRLKELGFPSGQEPTDMKRAHRGGGGMSGVNYYKASYHNYVIFTPSKEDLAEAGISGTAVYSFHGGRAKVNPGKFEEKARLKQWVVERCKEIGIPVDETLRNGGFVDAPNDVMAFDFSEIWKCKKNFALNIPSLDYNSQLQGSWEGTDLVAPIGLVGDAVTEPFWISGVGLQRGWNGIMDSCYLIDNLYNLTFSGAPDPIEPTSWEDHVDRLQRMLPTLYECSHDGRMTKEGLQGEYADAGVVMTQLNKQLQDAEKPKWQLEIDPFARYEPLHKLAADKYKGARALENKHPVVKRQMALLRRRPESGTAVCEKKLISVCEKAAPTSKASANGQQQNSETPTPASKPAVPLPIPEAELKQVALSKNDSLHITLAKQLDNVLSKQIDSHINKSSAASLSCPFDDTRWKELPIQDESSGFAQIVEREWDVMTEKHLNPTGKAELQYIRNMKSSLKQQIASLQSSLTAFERAEMELLTSSSP